MAAHIEHIIGIFKLILKFLRICGLTNINFNQESQQFFISNGKLYLNCMYCFNVLVPLAYIGVRSGNEYSNMRLNSMQAGVRRAFNQPKFINDCSNAMAFLIFAWKFRKEQQQDQPELLHAINEALKSVVCIERIAKSKFSCSLTLLLALYVVLLKIVLALGWGVFIVQLDMLGLPDCVATADEYVASLALLLCSLSFHMQLLLYSCHYVLLNCLYGSYNRYLECLKKSPKTVKALGKLLERHAMLEQLHAQAIKYFSLYCTFLLLKTFFQFAIYVRQFKFDEQTLWQPVDEDLEELEVVCLETITRNELIWKAAVQLLWCLSTLMSLLFVAYGYQRERMCFASNVVHLVEYPEYFAHLATPASEMASPSQVLRMAGAEDSVQQHLPKYNIIDFMLDKAVDVRTLAVTHVTLMKLLGAVLPLREAIGILKLLIPAAFLIIILDVNHTNEMQLLNELVANDML